MWVEIFVIAIAAAADYAVVRRRALMRGGSLRDCRIMLALLWTADCVPLLMKGIGRLAGDNPQIFCDVATWVMFAYLLVIVPKTVIFAALLASRRRIVHAAGVAVAAAVAAALLYGLFCDRTDLIVNRTEVHSPRLPQSFDGFRIVLFSDLHIGSLLDAESETERVVETINSLDADAVFFCGDLVDIRHTELDDSMMRILGRIRSRCGTYSVTGNHDTGFYVRDTIALPTAVSRRLLLEKERGMGWHPLEGESIHLRRGDDSISVTGIPFSDVLSEIRHSRRIPQMDIAAAYEGVDTASYNITLTHIPQMWRQVRALGRGDLTLSGHVHAMQLKFKLCGRWFSPARIQYPLWSGLYADDSGSALYINDGIGTVGVPVRIGARPEITLITLRR